MNAQYTVPAECQNCGESNYYLADDELLCGHCDVVVETKSNGGGAVLQLPPDGGVTITGSASGSVEWDELAEVFEGVDITAEGIADELEPDPEDSD